MITFETVLKEINDFGKYQKVRYFLICIAALLPPIVTYIHSFVAANPGHRCKNPYDVNDSFSRNSFLNLSSIKSLDECSITYFKGENNSTYTEKCDEWVFDETFYQSTLTEDWSMVCDKSFLRGAVQTVYFMGYLIGSIVMGILADNYGRKPIMLSAFVMMIVGCIGTSFGPRLSLGISASYAIYAFSRFLIACGTRGINVTGFVLGTEMMGNDRRTFAGLVFQQFFGVGQLILVAIAYFVRDWETLSVIVLIITLPFISYFFILPESPRWLLSKKRDDDALKIIQHVAEINKSKLNMDTWNKLIENDQLKEVPDKQESLIDSLKSPKLFIISIILYLQWIINNFVFYGVGLKSNDLGVSPYLSFSISATMEILSIAFTHAILDKLGRKLPYCALLFLAGASCLSIIFIDSVIWELVFAMIGKFCASGSYAIIYLYSSELFPTSIRNSCMGACSMMARIGSMMAPLVLDIGQWKDLPFLVFGISGIVGAVTAVMLPETLNRPLPENINDCEDTSQFGLKFRYKKAQEGEETKEMIQKS